MSEQGTQWRPLFPFPYSVASLSSIVRPLLATRLLDRVFARSAIVSESAFGILLGCRSAVRQCLGGHSLQSHGTRGGLIAFRNGIGSTLMFLGHGCFPSVKEDIDSKIARNCCAILRRDLVAERARLSPEPRPEGLGPAGPVDITCAGQVFDVHDVDGRGQEAGDLVEARFEIDALHVRRRSALAVRRSAIANAVGLAHGRHLWNWDNRGTQRKPARGSRNEDPLAGLRVVEPRSCGLLGVSLSDGCIN